MCHTSSLQVDAELRVQWRTAPLSRAAEHLRVVSGVDARLRALDGGLVRALSAAAPLLDWMRTALADDEQACGLLSSDGVYVYVSCKDLAASTTTSRNCRMPTTCTVPPRRRGRARQARHRDARRGERACLRARAS
jgi:hypothetical protein